LKLFAKDLETNLKSENRKEERKEKYELDPRGSLSAQPRKEPTAQQETIPNRYPSFSLPLTDSWDPLVSLLPPAITPPSFLSGYWKRPPLLPSSILINACPFRHPAHTYK
jgi:hypothetical protein